MRWLPPENELDREQREFLKNLITRADNEQILGFPGSGKTVLLLYGAMKLKELKPKAKILFVEFTHALIKMIEAAIEQMPYHDMKVVTYYDFYNNRKQYEAYDYILCDEVQDVPKKVIEMMKAKADRVIVAGDPNQSIYEEDPQWGLPPCKQEELEAILTSSELPLTIIHRLSKYVISAVDKYLPDMKITSGKFSMVRSHPKIRLWKGRNQRQEVEEIFNDAKDYLRRGDTIGILLPTHSKIQKFANRILAVSDAPIWEVKKDDYGKTKYDELNAHFEKYNIPMQFVAKGFGNFTQDTDKIVLTTYHSSKGLDFDRVYLPFCNHVDEYSNYDMYDKVLFMVAMTRSRGDLVISFTGTLNYMVASFKDDCTYRNLDDSIIFSGDWDNLGQEKTSDTKNEDIFDW